MSPNPPFKKILTWEETLKHGDFVKKCALQQFLEAYHRTMLRTPDELKYGDELECYLIEFDNAKQAARLLLNGEQFYDSVTRFQQEGNELAGIWALEYASFQIESTPAKPFEGLSGLGDVERNMNDRRREARAMMKENERLVTVPSFPRLGCPGALAGCQDTSLNGPLMDSIFLPDSTVTPELMMT